LSVPTQTGVALLPTSVLRQVFAVSNQYIRLNIPKMKTLYSNKLENR
jgi:hypothetical protein